MKSKIAFSEDQNEKNVRPTKKWGYSGYVPTYEEGYTNNFGAFKRSIVSQEQINAPDPLPDALTA